MCRRSQTRPQRPLLSRLGLHLSLSQIPNLNHLSLIQNPIVIMTMMIMTTTVKTTTTRMMTMTDNPALKQIRAVSAKLREQIAQEVADMNQSDLWAVLRMIEQWKAGR
jgi:hypothetical protein